MTVPRSNASHDQNHVPTLMGVSTTDGTTPVPVEVDPTTGQLQVSSTGSGGGGAATIADGADVAEGATTDAAVTAGSSGTVSGKLRQISADVATTTSNQTNGTQQTKLTDGTNSANVLKSDGTAAGQNAALVSGTGMTTTTISLSLGTQASAWYDLLNYPWISVEILTNASAATITWQNSGDSSQTNINSMPMQTTASNIAALQTTTSATTGNFYGPRQGRYFRINTNLSGANTATLVLTMYTTPATLAAMGVTAAQSGTWTVGSNSATGSAVPANAHYIGVLNSSGNLVGAACTDIKGDGATGSGIQSSGPFVYNGTFYDRIRSANNATGTTGTGVPASGVMGFDGTNYQRLKTDTTGVASINTAQINGVATTTGNGVSGTGVQRVTLASDSTGQVALAAGSAIAGKVGIDQTTPGTTNAVVNTPVTSGGLSIITGSVGATATVIKASAGQLYGYHFLNTTAAVAYVQIFNVAAASVTLGVTSPTISIGIPASGGVTVNWDKGVAFGTAMSYACTTTRAGASGATCDVNFFYA